VLQVQVESFFLIRGPVVLDELDDPRGATASTVRAAMAQSRRAMTGSSSSVSPSTMRQSLQYFPVMPSDPRKNKRGFRRGSRVRTGSSGRRLGGRRRPEAQEGALTAAEGRAVPRRSSGRGESRTSDGTHQRSSWGGEVAGARGRGLEERRRCSRMARADTSRRYFAERTGHFAMRTT
jgi:hypothetical protein